MRLILIWLLFFFILFRSQAQDRNIQVNSSNKELNEIFIWAKIKARSFVVTGKEGPINVYKRNQETNKVKYFPAYWAGYPLRTAFYSRDFCHQAIGAHLLGLEEENFNMLKSFASSSSSKRKWFPLWAINFDGSIYTLDYKNDTNFVREIPAVFELVQINAQLFDWTKDKRYLIDSNLKKFNSMALSEFIILHDKQKKNGVAESDGSGNIFEGTSTYNEASDQPLIESGDGIGSQYQAYLGYSKLAALNGEKVTSKKYNIKAAALKKYFNKDWGIKGNKMDYNRGYDQDNKPVSGWGKENSWFLPLKEITDSKSHRNSNYLDFIHEQLSSKTGLPENIEAITYIPEIFFKYGQDERGWKWLKFIISKINSKHAEENLAGTNGNYPEVSFVLISNVVKDIAGVEPGYDSFDFETCSHLPKEIKNLKISNIKIGNQYIHLEHTNKNQSILSYCGNIDSQIWRAGFQGVHPYLYVNGSKTKSKRSWKNGFKYSYIDIKVEKNKKYIVENNKP